MYRMASYQTVATNLDDWNRRYMFHIEPPTKMWHCKVVQLTPLVTVIISVLVVSSPLVAHQPFAAELIGARAGRRCQRSLIDSQRPDAFWLQTYTKNDSPMRYGRYNDHTRLTADCYTKLD